MAEHPFQALLRVGSAWLDVTNDVRQTSLVTITKGGGEVSQAPRPSSLSLTLNDQVGKYRPDRAASPLYGKVGRNTPISVPGGIFEVSGWSPDRTVDHDPGTGRGDQTTDVDAGGVLRRIGTWSDNIESAISQSVTSQFAADLLGFWRLEDPAGAVYPAPVVGVLNDPRLSFNADFGQADAPAGANASVQLSPSSAVSGGFLPGSATAGWTVGFAFKLAQLPTAANFNRMISIRMADQSAFSVWINNTSFRVQVSDNTTATVDTTDFSYASSLGPTVWTFMELRVTHTSSTTSAWELDWYGQNDTGIWTFADTAPIPSGVLDRWQISGNDWTDRGLFCCVAAVSGVTDDFLNFNGVQAFNGWVGETAGTRFGRLMDLSGLPWQIKGDPADTARMGPQGANTLLEHLREIRDTEDGILYDSPDMLAVTLRTRADLYAQTPALALTYGLNLAPPFLPVIGDLGVANVVTVAQRAGATYVARDDVSSMGTLPPPDGMGEKRQRIDVNLAYDGDLQGRAEWALAIGTNPEARYSSVVLDLDANPSLGDAASALEPGDRVTVTGADPDVTDLMVVGITDKYDTKFRRTVTLTCRPYRPYGVGVYGIPRYDAGTSVTNGAKDATQTSWAIKCMDPSDAWSQTSLPYPWMVAGELIMVTGMSAPSGTGPFTQSATVRRSVNGVVKGHADGEQINIATPGRWAL